MKKKNKLVKFHPQTSKTPCPEICPVCHTPACPVSIQDRLRPYLTCPVCQLTFVPPAWHLTEKQEKMRYDQHNNSIHDQGYRKFLHKLVEPMLKKININSIGLDFGCGPQPVMSILFAEYGYYVYNYDLFYHNYPHLLEKKYNFITCSEVIEHLKDPIQEFKKWIKMLLPGGWLGIMTSFLTPNIDFLNWRYKNDTTHINFFSSPTFTWIGKNFGLQPIFPSQNIVLFQNKIS